MKLSGPDFFEWMGLRRVLQDGLLELGDPDSAASTTPMLGADATLHLSTQTVNWLARSSVIRQCPHRWMGVPAASFPSAFTRG